ncbi:hypothetical protein ACJ72_07710 [Emergomyces africanus]|uniref:SET domain-containing protein n=1 Tax=Emergomyces africanus TaxID=1955775 RepID=A0A1B7NMF5_9EURO|nr:hypothetical protein ACJ72_07710 [Emergomyces africanus]
MRHFTYGGILFVFISAGFAFPSLTTSDRLSILSVGGVQRSWLMTFVRRSEPVHQLEKFARVALEPKDTIFVPPPPHPPPHHHHHHHLQNSITHHPIDGSLLERQHRVLEEVSCQIMTDTSSLATTHSTANPNSVTAQPLPSPVAPAPAPNGNNNNKIAITQSVQEDEEEPYTIKCICAFEDDDGHTVFCERCETWQHILCYYDGEDVPEVHNCADCEPRPLDSKLATELQKKRREEQSDGGDRKSKRSGSKSQRKKTAKDNTTITTTTSSSTTAPAPAPATTTTTPNTATALATDGGGDQTNGWSSQERSGSNSRDHQPPPAKKSKTSHRASSSVSSLTGLPPPLGSDSRKRATSASAMSPTKASLIPNIPLYSQEFLHLYDHDQANVDIPSNLFDNLKLATDLSSWVQDPANLALVANGRSTKEVFTYLDRPLDPAQWPALSKQAVTDTSVEYDGRHPTWRFLTVESDVRKDEIIGEVKGKVGHFRDYCLDPNSRWQELRHPEPFVFFHPQLPIYIDSRKEGSQLRYVRRSCRPNVTMKTVITNDIEYHFCFVANQDIAAKSEITTSWYLDPQMFPSNNGFVKQEGSNDGISDAAAISISNVLANFGGCACDSSRACRLAKIDCRRPPKSAEPASKQANGRRKKSKTKNAISPVNTGLANNSRAASETVKAQVDDDRVENRSRSTSNRPRSRDLTPTTAHSPTDPLASMSGELSAREKRKIAAAEKKFEQLEHDKQHPQKKKKRSSGTSAQTTTTTTTAATSHTQRKPLRVDTTNNAQRSSNSPRKRSPMSVTPGPKSQSSQKKLSRSNTPITPSPLRRPHYVDSEMQTEPDENDPDYVPPKPPHRPSFVPLTTRLLKRCHEDRLRLQELGNRINASPGYSSTTTPLIPHPHHGTTISSPQTHREDVDMKDADTGMTPPKKAQHATAMAATPPSPGATSALSSLHISPDQTTTTPHTPLHPLPSTAAHNFPMPRKPPDRAHGGRDLRVQLPPPPQFTTSSTTTTSSQSLSHPITSTNNTPISSTPNPLTQSPFPITPNPNFNPSPGSTQMISPGPSVTGPSPVKKKLSLGDYMSRRGTLTTTPTTPMIEKPQPPLFPLSQSPPQQQQMQPGQSGQQGNHLADKKDKKTEKLTASPDGLGGGSVAAAGDSVEDVIMQDADQDAGAGGDAPTNVDVPGMLSPRTIPKASPAPAPAPVTSVVAGEAGNNSNGNDNSGGGGGGVSKDPRLQPR